nr:toxin-antitoxin system HicB family antitoxin [uncultured Acetatifactor sp.]
MCYYERFYYLNERIKMLRVEDYMKLPYTRIVQEMNDESGHYFYGRILELDGCQSTGDTIEELYESLNEAMEGYIEVKLENNLPIPEPERADDYSGKFNVRLPKTLHQRLAIEAQNEGVSLNTLVLYKLAL